MYIYERKKIVKPGVYTSTKMEDHVQDGSKTFFNLKTIPVRKLLHVTLFFFFPSFAGGTIDSTEAVRSYVIDFNVSMTCPLLLTLVHSGGLKPSKDH